ncbi:non-specific serine/threonine protein kinase [Caenorhabditis elegans]|uniref:non-specific serine/threonine protein kinase n=1 Tax=Caenorhabditis elegans TaxID=6239 RepID=Q965F6_CAEEL|nr:Protein kinase domain-containing protein [Caenorhabditis elegans]CCD68544.1 Protein kinase domain-containing protein [Caenorhabditis elegans]|eukprot:NP_503160.1 protein KINase [Caenorhabditis elegans]
MAGIAQSTTSPASATTEKPIYNVVRFLSEGTYGQVSLYESSKNPDVKIAVKQISTAGQSERFVEHIKTEFAIHKGLSKIGGHRNVISMMEMRKGSDCYTLLKEYADGGDLFKKLETEGEQYSENAQCFFKQLISGLKFIHEHEIVHRDIKLENLLLMKSKSNLVPDTLKIADFGLATEYMVDGEELMLVDNCGSPPYAAPEVYSKQGHRGPPTDVWSSGVILMAMLTAGLPWDCAHRKDVDYAAWIDKKFRTDNLWNDISDRALALLRKILCVNVSERVSIEQIEADPWFTFDYAKRIASQKPSARSCYIPVKRTMSS